MKAAKLRRARAQAAMYFVRKHRRERAAEAQQPPSTGPRADTTLITADTTSRTADYSR